MPRRNDIAKILIIGSGLVAFGVFCSAVSAPTQPSQPIRKISVVVECASGLDQPPDHVFANPGVKDWKEYARTKDVPPLDRDTGEQMFTVTLLSAGRKLVSLTEYNEDAAMLQTYCYDQAGALRSLNYEIRTDWGWGYAEKRILGGAGHVTKRFFDTASNQTIKRPRQADDVPSFLQATIYPRFDALPFVGLLKKPRANATQK
jgi:hypothetical protein